MHMPGLRSRHSILALLSLALGPTLLMAGCNLFGRLDNPSDPRDVSDAAVQLANNNDCGDATNVFNGILVPTDQIYSNLGWSEMCQGGITAQMLAGTLYQYSSSATNYYALGRLARAMLPINATGYNQLTLANNQFGGMLDASRRAMRQAIVQFAIAAWILGKQATSTNGALTQASISPNAACANDASNCAASTNCVSGMSSSDLQKFNAAISAANGDLAQLNAQTLGGLSSGLNTGLTTTPTGAATSTTVGLCYIYNFVIPNP